VLTSEAVDALAGAHRSDEAANAAPHHEKRFVLAIITDADLSLSASEKKRDDLC
jgi:hypothetical protein